MPAFTTRPLEPDTWPAFAALVERHNGVWGGCWCMSFHPEGLPKGTTPLQHRQQKQSRVCAGTAHAALVFDADDCIGWCQFGSPEELPRIKHRRAYEEVEAPAPDWRLTCFFVDKRYRGQGVAAVALAGAVKQIAALGGGLVEAYPEEIGGRKVSGSFLWGGTLEMFEQHGFERGRQLGKRHWVMSRRVRRASPALKP